ncbi:MAG TPA: DUF1330 domain-containing protein [Solirubrobacteraceae bacterium]|nr:DUF1330 domain-containing protein [Solirubrobacteraceae bacterium]
MPAYVIVDVTVHDPETYKEYAAGTPGVIAQYDGRFIVRGGAVTPQEGDWSPQRIVVLEFADMAAARRWYDSPEYQALLPIRERAATSRLIFVEGYDG